MLSQHEYQLFGINGNPAEVGVPYSQRYLFNAIHDTNHNANPTNPTNRNTRYRCE